MRTRVLRDSPLGKVYDFGVPHVKFGQTHYSKTGLQRLPILRPALIAGLLLLLAFPAGAVAGQVKSGFYEGETDIRCPPFAVASDICGEDFKLPVSFTVKANRISDLRIMVVEHCEDNLPERMEVVELPQSLPLKREWGPRAGVRWVFDSKPHSRNFNGNRTFGTVWPGGRTNGYLSVLTKVAGDSYCTGGAEWRAGLHAHGKPRSWPEIPPPKPVEVNPISGLRQACLSAAAIRPTVKAPLRMIRAGIWPNTGFRYEQAVVGAFSYRAMPTQCATRYGRSSRADIQILRRGRWATVRIVVAGAGNRGGTSRVSTYGGHPDIPARFPEYDTCGSNHRFHKVRIRVTSRLTRPALQKQEGRRHQWTYPVAVAGNCAAAAVSARRVRKLQHEYFGTPLAATHRFQLSAGRSDTR